MTTSRAAETAAIVRALPDEKHGPSGGDFDAVYAALWAPITRFAHLVVGSREVGEELTQEAFVGLLRHFDGVENPQAYLRRSIVNRASRHRGRPCASGRYSPRPGNPCSSRRNSTRPGRC